MLLFRYSALTFNGHRIHYDRDYVTKVEGYPGLIFHGPMQAAFLVEFAARLHGGVAPRKFSYRGLQPLFEGEFSVNAGESWRWHGIVDGEFGGPADHEGHRDVVRGSVPLPACGERVGVRGSHPNRAFGGVPSPAAHPTNVLRPLPASGAR